MTQVASLSDVGRARPGNEDAYCADTDLQLFVVADGMGGHRAGEVASQLAVDTIEQFIRTSQTDPGITWPFGLDTKLPFGVNQLRNAIQLANQQIMHAGNRRAELNGMGSTVVAVLVRKDRAIHANVGDSRAYVLRRGKLRQITEDHSWAETMRRAGMSDEAVNAHDMRHMLTRALGSEQGSDVSFGEEPLEVGDLVLLCSDGLYGPVGDDGIEHVLTNGSADLSELAARLIQAANDAGGPDNVTVVLIRHTGPEPAGKK
jgi:serine/threonine protein phosphatase PrpC